MSLDAVVLDAQVGLAIGTAAGLVPLGVGYFYREKKKAVSGFFGCMLGGAIGGIYMAIVIMAITTERIMQPQRKTGEQASFWSGLANVADMLWYVAAFFWLLISVFSIMVVSAVFLTPLVLGVPNSGARDSLGKIVEPLMLFGGMGLGMIIGFVGVSFISRRFISSKTHTNWARDFELSTLNGSKLQQKLARFNYGMLLPRDCPSLRK